MKCKTWKIKNNTANIIRAVIASRSCVCIKSIYDYFYIVIVITLIRHFSIANQQRIVIGMIGVIIIVSKVLYIIKVSIIKSVIMIVIVKIIKVIIKVIRRIIRNDKSSNKRNNKK